MHTLFIGDRLLKINTPAEPIAGADLVLRIPENAGHAMVSGLIDSFEKNEQAGVLIFQTDNPDRLWELVCDCFSKIEAAGGVVLNEEKSVLMIYRNGKWDLPKGKLELNELPADGAVREVEEECGLSGLEILKALDPTFHTYSLNGKKFIKKTFWFAMHCSDTAVPVPQLDEGITEVKWWSPTEMGIPMMNTYASVNFLLNNYLRGGI